MQFLPFGTLPLILNLVIFIAAGLLVWLAGVRLSTYAHALSVRTRMSQAFLGIAILGVATSLAEVATTISGAYIGNADLVAGNLFGGVALQITVLAIVDLIAVRGALTYFAPNAVLLFQGAMLVLMLSLALAGGAIGDPFVLFGVGLTSVLLAVAYLVTLRISMDETYLPRWKPSDESPTNKKEKEEEPDSAPAGQKLYWYLGIATLTIFVCGWLLAQTGDALAEQTNLGSSFVGAVLIAAATSLPELSTATTAARQGNHEMAVSNILGTNCLEVGLFFIGDLFYRQGSIFGVMNRSAFVGAILGLLVTSIFLIGLLERRNRTVFGMGIDSLAVLVTYIVGLGGLYYVRNEPGF
jgi:cation:H+ antiporter